MDEEIKKEIKQDFIRLLICLFIMSLAVITFNKAYEYNQMYEDPNANVRMLHDEIVFREWSFIFLTLFLVFLSASIMFGIININIPNKSKQEMKRNE